MDLIPFPLAVPLNSGQQNSFSLFMEEFLSCKTNTEATRVLNSHPSLSPSNINKRSRWHIPYISGVHIQAPDEFSSSNLWTIKTKTYTICGVKFDDNSARGVLEFIGGGTPTNTHLGRGHPEILTFLLAMLQSITPHPWEVLYPEDMAGAVGALFIRPLYLPNFLPLPLISIQDFLRAKIEIRCVRGSDEAEWMVFWPPYGE